MGDVTSFINSREFRPAIEYLEQRTRQQPQYHVGWLRLGHARRELAADLMNTGNGNGDAVRDLLNSSLDALERAKGHSNRDYKAEAEYHTSKSYYRRWRLDGAIDDLKSAVIHAQDAHKLILQR